MIGDPLTMTAGVLREPLWPFVLIVAIAKTARYAVIAELLTLSSSGGKRHELTSPQRGLTGANAPDGAARSGA